MMTRFPSARMPALYSAPIRTLPAPMPVQGTMMPAGQPFAPGVAPIPAQGTMMPAQPFGPSVAPMPVQPMPMPAQGTMAAAPQMPPVQMPMMPVRGTAMPVFQRFPTLLSLLGR